MPEKQYIFGPVPSRRLGLSLGVDIVPRKTCTQNCVYCQLGFDAETTAEPGRLIEPEIILNQLKAKLDSGVKADYITFSGSGEPTLHTGLGDMIDAVRQISEIPVAVLTNGTLLHDPAVRKNCLKADLVLPSLDAGSDETFEKINKPDPAIDYDKFVQGLCDFTAEFKGPVWLEVFLVEGINTSAEELALLAEQIERIKPDKVQVNTAVRPTSVSGIKAIGEQRLNQLAQTLRQDAEVIASYPGDKTNAAGYADIEQAVVDLLNRRPCTAEDMESSLGVEKNALAKCLEHLEQKKIIAAETRDARKYYRTGK